MKITNTQSVYKMAIHIPSRKYRSYGISIVGVLVRLHSGDGSVKIFTDVPALKGNSMALSKVDLEGQVDLMDRRYCLGIRKPAAHVVKADWESEQIKGAAQQKEQRAAANVERKDVGGFSFMGLTLGEVYDDGSWTPARKFRRFTSYSKSVTARTGKLYRIHLSFYDYDSTIGEIGSEYRGVVDVLRRKYKVTPISASENGSSRQRTVFELGDGVSMEVIWREKSVELTLESRKLKDLHQRELAMPPVAGNSEDGLDVL